MRLLVSVFLIFITSSSLVAEDEKPELFVFIGKKISVEKTESVGLKEWVDAKTDELVTVLSSSSRYRAKYEVLEELEGNSTSRTLEFTTRDHYGEPRVAWFNKVILFLWRGDAANEWIYPKGKYIPVFNTQTGKLATCDPIYWGGDFNRENFPVEPIGFVEPIIEDVFAHRLTVGLEEIVPLNSSDLEVKRALENYLSEDLYRIQGRQVFCLKGLYIDDILEAAKQTILKERSEEVQDSPDS